MKFHMHPLAFQTNCWPRKISFGQSRNALVFCYDKKKKKIQTRTCNIFFGKLYTFFFNYYFGFNFCIRNAYLRQKTIAEISVRVISQILTVLLEVVNLLPTEEESGKWSKITPTYAQLWHLLMAVSFSDSPQLFFIFFLGKGDKFEGNWKIDCTVNWKPLCTTLKRDSMFFILCLYDFLAQIVDTTCM